MAGFYMKRFLLKVMGERSNWGHLWLSAALSFVIAHLRVHVGKCVCICLWVCAVCVWVDPCGE